MRDGKFKRPSESLNVVINPPVMPCDSTMGQNAIALDFPHGRDPKATLKSEGSKMLQISHNEAPAGYCLWCGAYLAGSFTQHTSTCWLYGYTKDVSLPNELRDYLKSLALRGAPETDIVLPFWLRLVCRHFSLWWRSLRRS